MYTQRVKSHRTPRAEPCSGAHPRSPTAGLRKELLNRGFGEGKLAAGRWGKPCPLRQGTKLQRVSELLHSLSSATMNQLIQGFSCSSKTSEQKSSKEPAAVPSLGNLQLIKAAPSADGDQDLIPLQNRRRGSEATLTLVVPLLQNSPGRRKTCFGFSLCRN